MLFAVGIVFSAIEKNHNLTRTVCRFDRTILKPCFAVFSDRQDVITHLPPRPLLADPRASLGELDGKAFDTDANADVRNVICRVKCQDSAAALCNRRFNCSPAPYLFIINIRRCSRQRT